MKIVTTNGMKETGPGESRGLFFKSFLMKIGHKRYSNNRYLRIVN
jgi:hypothetical protein